VAQVVECLPNKCKAQYCKKKKKKKERMVFSLIVTITKEGQNMNNEGIS
jgi:hypothetical protein